MPYRFKYSFWNQQAFPGFTQKVENIYNNSMLCASNAAEKQNVEESMTALEYYYVSLIKLDLIDKTNYNNVLSRLKTVSSMRTLKGKNSKLFGLTIEDDIYINPDIPSKNNLSRIEMKQLIASHELTHVINGLWVEESEAFSKSLTQIPNIKILLKSKGLDKKDYIKLGLDMIDEIVAEETSEKVAYRLSGKSRPAKSYFRDKGYIGRGYYSNLTYYGEFQDIVTKFARELSFLKCTEKTKDEEVLNRLIRASFRRGFLINLGEELTKNPERLENFVLMLAYMGKIKDGAYTVIGLSASGEKNVGKYFDMFDSLIEKNKSIISSTGKRRVG